MCEQPQEVLEALYAEAFSRFGTACLWSKQPCRHPTTEHARIIARTLRAEGGRNAYALARRIEEACDAADSAAA